MNMAGQPNGNFQEVEADVADVLGGMFGSASPDVVDDSGTRGEADSSSTGDATPQVGAGEAVVAPSASPDNLNQQALNEAASQPATAQPAPAAAPAATPPAAPEPAAAQPQPNEAALREASLQAQIQQLNEQLNALKSQPAQPGAQPAQPAAQPESGEPIKRYNLTLPQQLKEGLLSDNPETNLNAIQQMANDLGTIIHNQVLTDVKALLQNFQSQTTQAVTEQTQEAAIEKARTEYYEQFPDHNNPLILPIIQAEASKLAVEFPGLPWNEQFSATLGARVNGVLQNLRGGATAPTPPVPPQPVAPAPAARPAAMVPSGNRGAVPGSEPEGSDLILDTLSI